MQITVKEACEILHRSAQRVRAYIHESDSEAKLNIQSAVKRNGQWYMSRSEVTALRESIKRRKAQRRRRKKIKALETKVSSLKQVLRIVQLDNNLSRKLRGHFLGYIHEKLDEALDELKSLE